MHMRLHAYALFGHLHISLQCRHISVGHCTLTQYSGGRPLYTTTTLVVVPLPSGEHPGNARDVTCNATRYLTWTRYGSIYTQKYALAALSKNGPN